MLKAAIDRILELSKPHVMTINDANYCDRNLHYMPQERVVKEALPTDTMTSIVDYLANGTDDTCEEDSTLDRRYVLHVAGYDVVRLYTELNLDKVREPRVTACINPTQFRFGRYHDVESFIIGLQTYFVQDEATAALIKVVSNVTDVRSTNVTDNGIAQTVTAKTGVVTHSELMVPSMVTLRPYCTFSEVDQPARRFVLRLSSVEDSITAALFEADGDRWKHNTILAIRDWFWANIPAELRDDVIILA